MGLLIKNAAIMRPGGLFQGDLLTSDGIIVRIDHSIEDDTATVIDAGGKYLLPGGVDVHTHFTLDVGAFQASDDFHTGTIAAACGGTTTIVDHPGFGPQNCRLGHQIDLYHRLAEKSVIDYSFHGVFQHVDDQVLADMGELAKAGITSFKAYLTYGGKLADPDLLRILKRAKELGVIICAHCENDAIIAFLTQQMLQNGNGDPCGHPRSRPDFCEAEAVYRFLALAKAAGEAPVYVVHLSTALGLEAIRSARLHGQKNVFAETCTQYLLLDDTRYDDPREGLKYIMSPPLRGRADNQLLWDGLRTGDIDTLATDHCPFFMEKKLSGLGNFTRAPGGAPGVEARMALMFSEGFMRGRLTLAEVVWACCTNPARVFGLYPQKGALIPGSDADMALFDPDIETTLTKSMLHENVDYTPYEGIKLKGASIMTISRGEVVARNGEFVGTVGRGKFIKRSLPILPRR